MRVFITGASGFIGNAVARAFKNNGHTVFGLIRNSEKAHELQKYEIIPVIGSLEKPETYRQYLSQTEVWVHCAFENSREGIEKDALTVNCFVHAAQGSYLPKTLIYTSGIWVYGNTKGKVVDEGSHLDPCLVDWRPAHEERIISCASKSVKAVVIRPGCVYGGSGSLTSTWFSDAKNRKLSVIAEGRNRWAMIHLQDLARAYVLAAEKEASSAIFNIVDNSRSTLIEIAEAISCQLNITEKVIRLSPEEAQAKYGFFTPAMAIDQLISNERAKRILGWTPLQPQFIEDIQNLYRTWEEWQK